MRTLRYLFLCLVVPVAAIAVALTARAAAPTAENATPIGKQITAFTLKDSAGAAWSLSDAADQQAVVVVFLGTECPLAKRYAPRLAELASTYAQRGVAFVAIDSNRQDSLADIAHYVRVHALEFPVLKDPGNVVADQFGAVRTPEAFLLDRDRVVRYWGRIDDQYGIGSALAAPRHAELVDALEELLARKEVTTKVTEAQGCYIGRLLNEATDLSITYCKDVAPILQQNCVKCHRAGEIAPFSLATYDEVVGWAHTIREVVREQRMPPWHANPEHGKFYNDARLPDDAKQLVIDWVTHGAPEGNPADLPPPPKFEEGWQIPKPDVVYKMETPFTVPAKGVVQYQYFTVDPGFTEDRWIRAAEARPGNREITHHLILFFHPPGRDAIGPEEPLFNSVAAFAPGMPPAIYPEGYSRRIPAGSKLVFQVHYTPNGREQTDTSEIGIVFADPASVRREVEVQAGLNFRFRIPPGDANYRVEADRVFDQDTILYSLTPHMHLRGKSFSFSATYPDGKTEMLLDVPRYDFNWQNFYILAEPKLLPAGTQVHLLAHFDNSEQNLSNPDPRSAVTWGDQTWQEMMIGTFATSRAEQDFSLGLPSVKALEGDEYEVTFTYRPNKQVEAVYVAGSFNEWKPTGQKLDGPDSEGRHATRLKLKRGLYEYKFVINGTEWHSDPGNPRHAGEYRNSVLQVGEPE